MAARHTPRVLVISHDVVGQRMAGTGIRYWELARALAARQPVTLVAPQPIDLAPETFACGSYAWGDPASLAGWLQAADVVVANGYLLHAHPELADLPQPLVLDLYDPTLLENLELFRAAPADERATRSRQDHALLHRQLDAGDCFLCATERQRDLYIGALMAAGRITPTLVDTDPQLRRLIDVVSSGLPSEPPVKQRAVLRGVLPGIGQDDLLLLWTGGLWDWMDPLTLIRALPQVVAQVPNVRLVFLAGKHPGDVPPMQAPRAAAELAEARGLLNRHIFFYEEWIPYARRADFLLEADIAVSLHRDHLETAYAAIRSRLLDHLWAGLPSILSTGDAGAALFGQAGAARVVPPGDSNAVATAIVQLADGDQRAQLAQAARALAGRFTWDEVSKPVARFCREPRRTRAAATTAPEPIAAERPSGGTMTHFDYSPQEQEHILDASRNASMASQEQTWRLQERPLPGGILARVRRFVIDQFVRPFVMPFVEQQQTYNAAVLRTMYTLAEAADQRRSIIYQHLRTLHEHTERRFDAIEQRITSLEQRADALEEHERRIDGRADHLEQRMSWHDQRADQGEHNDRVIRHELHEIIEQLAGLEDADTQLVALLRRQPAAASQQNDQGQP